WMLVMPMLAGAIALGASCATKGYVKTQVQDVDTRVDSLSQSLEQTQERTKAAEGRIGDVDQKAQAAQGTADAATRAAGEADTKAVNAANKADELDKASRRLVYTVVLSDDEANFKLGKSDLPDAAKAKIDDMVNQLKADPKGAYFEIEGHTDSTGTKEG